MNAAIKPATLVHVRSVTERQVAFGNRLGVDISGKSVGVAKAMIEDAIQREFWGETPEAPTERQIALATQLGSDISETTRRVGSAIIEDIIYNLNKEAIVAQQLAPGVTVINKRDTLGRPQTISSIGEDGTVYFRGGNGARAWAQSLIRVEDNSSPTDT